MSDQADSTASDALEEVRYVLHKTIDSFGSDWERYKDDFDDIGASHTGRRVKYSVEKITEEHESTSFATTLRDVLEEFIADFVLSKFNSPGNPERFLILIKNFFSYLHKTTDWFHDIFSDFDEVAWPSDNTYSYSHACHSILHSAFYGSMRRKIRDNYIKQCKELRRRYSYENMDVFKCFYNKLAVPLFDGIEEWEQGDASFWWQPFYKELETIVEEKMIENCRDESTFVVHARCCMQAELFMFKYLPDNAEETNFKKMKGKLNDIICQLYCKRQDCSFLGVLTKNNFDKFLFGQLLNMFVSSPKQKDMLLMCLRSSIRMLFESRALELVQDVPNRPLTLEELKPLLIELEETKSFLWKRLEERLGKFPCLAALKSNVLDNCREQLEIYQIDNALVRTDGYLVRRLQEPVEIDSAFREEAKLIALYIKHLAWSDEFMNELEAFAEEKIASDHHDMVSTLAEFVSMHKSVCSNALCSILSNAKLIDE